MKWRIAWFRDRFPNGKITTSLEQFNGDTAVLRAEVIAVDGDGAVCGSATGYGMETSSGFANFVEKAETKAIGRALGAMGFGTQFADDFADAEDGAIADAPVQRQSSRSNGNQGRSSDRGRGSQNTTNQRQGGFGGSGPATGAQKELVMNMGAERDMTPQAIHNLVMESSGGVALDDLSRDQATEIIGRLKEMPRPSRR